MSNYFFDSSVETFYTRYFKSQKNTADKRQLYPYTRAVSDKPLNVSLISPVAVEESRLKQSKVKAIPPPEIQNKKVSKSKNNKKNISYRDIFD